ncbi:MAG: hypothetical protein IPI02_22640 [Sterolibacteriaceae bacterium]|nr:hypothetical protein [Sterolibacteriaceae bacterium]
MKPKLFGAACTLLLACLISESALAWCLGPRDCVTDDSVCDMGRNTTNLLGARTFVWSENPHETEIYTRLGAQQILDHCNDGQQLILHSNGRLSMDDRILSDVAKSFCRVSSISRSPVHFVEPISGAASVGFESKCIISKMDEARAAHLEREKQIPTATLVEEGNRTPDTPAAPTASADRATPSSSRAPDCGRIGKGVLFGLPGPCAGQGRLP